MVHREHAWWGLVDECIEQTNENDFSQVHSIVIDHYYVNWLPLKK